MLQIWTDKSSSKVYSAISAVTRQYTDYPHHLHADPSTYPEGGVVLVMGKTGWERLIADGVLPKTKNLTISSLRTKVLQHPVTGQRYIFTYAPGIGDIDYGKQIDLQTDVRLAYRLATTGTIDPPLGHYRYVDDFSEAIASMDAAVVANDDKPIPISLDTETLGLDPYAPGAYIISIQLTWKEGQADLVTFSSKEDYDARMVGDAKLGHQLCYILSHPKFKLRMANGKYDMHWFWVHGKFESTNYSMDTTAVGSCVDENRSNSLNVHAKVYTDIGGYDDHFNLTVNKARMDIALKTDPEGFKVYSGGDTDACLRVSKPLLKEICSVPPLARFYTTILHPALRAFEKVEQCGVLVDMDAYGELEHKLLEQMGESVKIIKEISGGRLLAKHGDPKKPFGLNPTKASYLCDYLFSPMGLNLKPKLFTPSGDAPATDKKHLAMFADHPDAKDFMAALRDFADANKTMTTYVTGFQKHIRSDGRFHPSYWLFAGTKDSDEGGTVTGRLSCKDPAFQTIPKHTKWAKYLRRCFIAPPGYRILENDYSQGELRVIACIANEPNMIQAYKENKDLHAMTAGPFRGFTYEQMMELKKTDKKLFDSIRQLGKAGNFGLLYGMSATGFDDDEIGGFQAYAKNSYRVDLTEKECNDFRNGFFQRYPVLLQYHNQYRQFALKHGYVMSPLGRVRHLPLIRSVDSYTASKAKRQALNSPVQSTLSDMMIWAIALAHSRGWSKEAPCFGMVHDAKYTYIPEDNWEMHAKREIELMEQLPFDQVGWKPQLTFTADGKVGSTLADLEEFSLT